MCPGSLTADCSVVPGRTKAGRSVNRRAKRYVGSTPTRPRTGQARVLSHGRDASEGALGRECRSTAGPQLSKLMMAVRIRPLAPRCSRSEVGQHFGKVQTWVRVPGAAPGSPIPVVVQRRGSGLAKSETAVRVRSPAPPVVISEGAESRPWCNGSHAGLRGRPLPSPKGDAMPKKKTKAPFKGAAKPFKKGGGRKKSY